MFAAATVDRVDVVRGVSPSNSRRARRISASDRSHRRQHRTCALTAAPRRSVSSPASSRATSTADAQGAGCFAAAPPRCSSYPCSNSMFVKTHDRTRMGTENGSNSFRRSLRRWICGPWMAVRVTTSSCSCRHRTWFSLFSSPCPPRPPCRHRRAWAPSRRGMRPPTPAGRSS